MLPSKEGGPEYDFADPEAVAVSPLGRGEQVAVLVALVMGPTLVKGDPGWAAGCEAAGCAADVVPPRLTVGWLLAGPVLGRALAKSGPPASLEEDTTARCKEAGCAAAIYPHILGKGALLSGVVPEKALAKTGPPADLKDDTAGGCEEAGCAAGVCPPRPKVGCLLADSMVRRAFAENSPPVAGLEESAAVLEGSPNKDDGPPPKRLGFCTAVDAVVVGVALVNGEAFETYAFHAFPCSNMDFDLLVYTV